VPELSDYLTDLPREINTSCSKGEEVIVECSQGTHLSLALSEDYPCCTSDNCTSVAAADDVGLNWQHIRDVVMVVKALPSRVGAGPLPFELQPEEEDVRGIAEYGVTTGRRRRKASEISWEHLETSVMLNGPTQIALTFCDHFDPEVRGVREIGNLTSSVRALIETLQEKTQVPVTLVKTGKYFSDIIQIN
jgi:adenylosuccinate synthase